MKSNFNLIIILVSSIILLSCGTERRYHKKRIDAGNNIPFVYFKKTVSKFDIYNRTEYYKNIPGHKDSVEIFLFGSQTEISNKQYSNFLNYLKKNDSIELYNKSIVSD
jgi:hypothetical protein